MNHLSGLNVSDPTSNLNSEEKDALASFRKWHNSCSDTKDTNSLATTYDVDALTLGPTGWRPLNNSTLYRFLAADRRKGKFDFTKSEDRLRNALLWRKEYGADSLIDLPPDGWEKYITFRVGIWPGVDFKGRPVHIERLGEYFSSGNRSLLTDEQWFRFYAWDLEVHFQKMRKSAEKMNKAVDKFIYCADFKGIISGVFNRNAFNLVPLLKTLVKVIECHYPEIVDKIILINVPRVSMALYAVIKRFLDPETVAKIEFHSSVPYKRLLELMSNDVIPEEYGGTNKIDYPHTTSK